MIADAAVVKDLPKDGDEESTPGKSKEVIHRKLSSKEDIKNYVKGII